MLDRLAGEPPGGPPPRRAGRRRPHARPAGCCSAGCWPASTRSTWSCRARLGLLLRGDRPLRPAAAASGTGRGPPATRRPLDRQAAGAALEIGRPGRRAAHPARGGAGRPAAQRRRRGARPEAAGPGAARGRARGRAGCSSWRYAAGLLDVGGPHRDEWLPTRGYDIWREQDLPDRWAVLAAGWLGGVRLPSLVGQRDVAGKAVNPLSPDLVRHTAPGDPPVGARRPRRVPGRFRAGARRPGRPAALAHAPAGRPAGAGPRHARRGRAGSGIVVGGVLSTAGRGLLAAGEDGAADGMRGLLPEPVDHVLAQPDLSLIAPGPLVADLADTLAVVADVESSGGATVFRVSEASIRRALDAGWSAADLHDFFTRASRTPVPQALDYLVDDVARQHGRLRVGRDRVLRPLRRPRAALPGAQRPAQRGAPSCAGWRPGCWSAGWAPTRCSPCCATAGLRPGRREPGRRRPHPAAGRPAGRRAPAGQRRAPGRPAADRRRARRHGAARSGPATPPWPPAAARRCARSRA